MQKLGFQVSLSVSEHSQVGGLKVTWSGLSDSKLQNSCLMSTTKPEEGIVGVDGTSNQAMTQRSSRTLPGIHLNFPRSGFVLQDRPSFVG